MLAPKKRARGPSAAGLDADAEGGAMKIARSSATDRLLRGVLERAGAAATEERITIDASGTVFHTTKGVLGALGPSSFFAAQFDLHASVITLSCPGAAFEPLFEALRLAVSDLPRALCVIYRAFNGLDGLALKDLCEELGLDWLNGELFELPGLPPMGTVTDVARLKKPALGGVLQGLADASKLPHEGKKFGERGPAAPGVIRVGRQTSWARQWSDSEPIFQLLDFRREPLGAGQIAEGCYLPYVISDGDRLVFDVGPGRFLCLQSLVMGLTSLEDEDQTITVEIASAAGCKGGGALTCSGAVRCRRHAMTQDMYGRWVAPPQTCTVFQHDIGDQGPVFVDRVFAVTFRLDGQRTLGLYHVDLFGQLLEAPASLPARCDGRAPFTFNSGERPCCCQEAHYLEELQYLRELGLLDWALQNQLAEMEGEVAATCQGADEDDT